MNVPGQAGAAEAAFQRVVDLDPSRADAYYELGLLRAKRGDAVQRRGAAACDNAQAQLDRGTPSPGRRGASRAVTWPP